MKSLLKYATLALFGATWRKGLVSADDLPEVANPLLWNNANPFPNSQIALGSNLQFTIPAAHALLEFATEQDFVDCNFNNAALISDGQNALVAFNSVGTRFFGCNKGAANSHCVNTLQKIAISTVIVTGSPTSAPVATLPPVLSDVVVNYVTGTIIGVQNVVENQRVVLITFQGSTDNVLLLRGPGCDFTGAQLITNTVENVEVDGQIVPAFTFIVDLAVAPFTGLVFNQQFTVSSNAVATDCNNGKKVTFLLVPPSPTVSPTKSPTSFPTNSPTTRAPTRSPTDTPTASPLISINTEITWGKPSDLVRFNTNALLTQGEIVTFFIPQAHNLVEFLREEDFLNCNFNNNSNTVDFNNGGSNVRVPISFEPGTVRYFGCSLVDAVTQLNHCNLFQQKMKVTTIKRNLEEFQINWNPPRNADEVAAYATPKEVLKDQAIRFLTNAANPSSVFQFVTKDAFTNCRAAFPDAIEILSALDTKTEIVYHDAFIESAPNQELYFGAAVNACNAGQKVVLKVVEEFSNGDGDGEEDENGSPAGIIVGVIIAVLAVVAVVAYVVLTKKAGKSPIQHEEVEKGKNVMPATDPTPAPVQHYAADTPRSPATSAAMRSTVGSSSTEGPTGTASLARSKAALSGLNF